MPNESGNTVLVENARTGPSEALILSSEALELVADLVRTFRPRVKELLAKRVERQRMAATQGRRAESSAPVGVDSEGGHGLTPGLTGITAQLYGLTEHYDQSR